jgi:hypothetical protein
MELPTLHLPRGLLQFTSRLLDWHDLAAVLTFRKQIFATLPPMFRLTNPDCDDVASAEFSWASKHLRDPGMTLGVFYNAEMVAFASLILPQAETGSEISRLIGLSKTEVARSAQMAACMVAEDFRGLRLQSKLLAWRRDTAIQAGRSLIVAMTACGNLYSLRNMIDAGMSIRWVGELTPRRWWQILATDLQPDLARRQLTDHVWVKGDDYVRQAMLTAQGFEGLAEISCPGADGKLCTQLEFAHRTPLTSSTPDLAHEPLIVAEK